MNTPRFEYSRKEILEKIDELMSLSAPYGCTVRYAVKANPHAEILKMMDEGWVYPKMAAIHPSKPPLESRSYSKNRFSSRCSD